LQVDCWKEKDKNYRSSQFSFVDQSNSTGLFFFTITRIFKLEHFWQYICRETEAAVFAWDISLSIRGSNCHISIPTATNIICKFRRSEGHMEWLCFIMFSIRNEFTESNIMQRKLFSVKYLQFCSYWNTLLHSHKLRLICDIYIYIAHKYWFSWIVKQFISSLTISINLFFRIWPKWEAERGQISSRALLMCSEIATITSGNLLDSCEVCTAYVIDYMT
jgi:hypothetical protein